MGLGGGLLEDVEGGEHCEGGGDAPGGSGLGGDGVEAGIRGGGEGEGGEEGGGVVAAGEGDVRRRRARVMQVRPRVKRVRRVRGVHDVIVELFGSSEIPSPLPGRGDCGILSPTGCTLSTGFTRGYRPAPLRGECGAPVSLIP